MQTNREPKPETPKSPLPFTLWVVGVLLLALFLIVLPEVTQALSTSAENADWPRFALSLAHEVGLALLIALIVSLIYDLFYHRTRFEETFHRLHNGFERSERRTEEMQNLLQSHIAQTHNSLLKSVRESLQDVDLLRQLSVASLFRRCAPSFKPMGAEARPFSEDLKRVIVDEVKRADKFIYLMGRAFDDSISNAEQPLWLWNALDDAIRSKPHLEIRVLIGNTLPLQSVQKREYRYSMKATAAKQLLERSRQTLGFLLHNLAQSVATNAKVRLLNQPPAFFCLITENSAVLQPYLPGRRPVAMPVSLTHPHLTLDALPVSMESLLEPSNEQLLHKWLRSPEDSGSSSTTVYGEHLRSFVLQWNEACNAAQQIRLFFQRKYRVWTERLGNNPVRRQVIEEVERAYRAAVKLEPDEQDQSYVDLHLLEPAVLVREMLNYVPEYRERRVVIKYGGTATTDLEPNSKQNLHYDVALLYRLQLLPILVIGGFAKIRALLQTVSEGGNPSKQDLLPIPQQAMPRIERQVREHANRVAKAINTDAGAECCEVIEGQRIIECLPYSGGDGTLGQLGIVQQISIEPVEACLSEGRIPLITSLGRCPNDGNIYFCNSDFVAAHVFLALRSTRLIYLSNEPGILPKDSISRVYSIIEMAQLEQALKRLDKRPSLRWKLESAQFAFKEYVKRAEEVDGAHRVPNISFVDSRAEHALFLELFTDAGVGTQLVADNPDKGLTSFLPNH